MEDIPFVPLGLLLPTQPQAAAPIRRRQRQRMNTSSLSSTDLQSHLYQSFLDGKTTDVALKVSGSWHAIYNLHRVVLIQSGFFRTLFTAGFSEAGSARSPKHSSLHQELTIVFDDRNITRAAFELCISRLYGGGPQLHVSPALRPTLSHPLTPGFPYFSDYETAKDHQPATPQFLLSLLATSIYLSIPSIASQALSTICGTIGPYTVTYYLSFALGRTIDQTDSYSQESAVGLENIADTAETSSDTDDNVGCALSQYASSVRSRRRSPSPDASSSDESPTGAFERISSIGGKSSPEPLTFHYGAVSDKIGEAVSAWLARWGADLLIYEEQITNETLPTLQPTEKLRKRAKTIVGLPSTHVAVEHDFLPQNHNGTANIPLIWRRGGLPPDWVRALISSDSFFVKDESERYNFAKRVVELRRSSSSDLHQEEEREWSELFEKGIYYSNMIPDEIISISGDISPATKQPYVPLRVLQAANWSHTLLRHEITAKPTAPAPTPASPKSKEKDLGIIAGKDDVNSDTTALFPIPGDETLRVGEHGGPSSETKGISMEQLFAHSHSPLSEADAKPTSEYPITFNESSFFGLLSKPSKSPMTMYSQFPPYRFSVEFFDIEALKEKQRLHSQTIWYAGSLFNVYIQVVKKKGCTMSGQEGQQLGIYVCRQSTVETVPPVSAPNPTVLRLAVEDGKVNSRAKPTIHHIASTQTLPSQSQSHITAPGTPTSPSTVTRSPTPVSPTSRPGTSSSLPSYSSFPATPSYRDEFGSPYSLPYTLPGVAPVQPYRDSRPIIMAYFMVYCSSPTGSSQTRFKSAPDQFKISQSWGWKSSSLRGDDMPVGDDKGEGQKAKVSLRATVILGVV